MTKLWRVHLLEGPQMQDPTGQVVSRFRSQRVGALLAYLALRLGKPCPREEICAELWPDEDDLQVTSRRLRVTLASLRRQMEPPGIPFGTVLDVSDTRRICLRAETVWCDVTAIDAALRAGDRQEAARLLNGSLLPGYYDEWIVAEQVRFEMLREDLEPHRAAETLQESSLAPLSHLEPSGRRPTIRRSNSLLPTYLTRFFGREVEEERLLTLLCERRFVTVVGPGGIGKTRLAVEAACRSALPVIWVSLAEVRTEDRIPEAILRALNVLPSVHQDLLEQATTVLLHRQPVLLALDNAEHLAEAAQIALSLLSALPDLSLLVTSRQPLEVYGEALLPLGSMQMPAAETDLEALAAVPTVALFVDRARQVRPDFALTARHAPALVQICRLLGGMPLAIELAAARVAVQTPSQIASSLESGLMGLQTNQRGVAERHRSLRTALRGSYDLLPAEAQAFFAALAVFEGSWTMDAARRICADEQAESRLAELVTRSLVTVHEDELTGEIRYSLLEPLRLFAAEQLSIVVREHVRQRHTAYYLALAASVDEDDIRTFAPLDTERENLLAALEAGAKQRSELFWRGLSGMLIHAFVRGRHRSVLEWMEFAQAEVASIQDPRPRFAVRWSIALVLVDIGRLEECLHLVEQGGEDAEANNDLVGVVRFAVFHGHVLFRQGNLEEAVRLLRSALQQARALQDYFALSRALSMTANVLSNDAQALGSQTDEGAALLQEAEELIRELIPLVPSYSPFLSSVWIVFCYILSCQQKPLEAYRALKECQRIALAHNKLVIVLCALYYESAAALDLEQYEYAALRFGGVLELLDRTGYDFANLAGDVDRFQARLKGPFTAEDLNALLKRGRQTPLDDFVSESLPEIALSSWSGL